MMQKLDKLAAMSATPVTLPPQPLPKQPPPPPPAPTLPPTVAPLIQEGLKDMEKNERWMMEKLAKLEAKTLPPPPPKPPPPPPPAPTPEPTVPPFIRKGFEK